MEISHLKVSVRDLVSGFTDKNEEGVVGYDGNLDIRPPYQREFIYKPPEQVAVVNSIFRGFPLNVMYWIERDDGNFEVLDGQQRTLSICNFHHGDFSIKNAERRRFYFEGLPACDQQVFLDYELLIYVCKGTFKDTLEWFRIINIAGKKLTTQEIRNAFYSGPWVQDAKKWFSQNNGPAYNIGRDYVSGVANRQEYLETAIKWHSDTTIDDYMTRNKNQKTATPLWSHFSAVLDWTKSIFPVCRPEMKYVDWGRLFKQHGHKNLDPLKLEKNLESLMLDDDIQNRKGIYEYLLSGNEKSLKLRTFTEKTKRIKYEEQKGKCLICLESFNYSEMEGDHIVPWSKNGSTEAKNCQMLCMPCNRAKGAN